MNGAPPISDRSLEAERGELLSPGVRLFRGRGALDRARSAWEALEESNDSPAFQRVAWAESWLDHFGTRGELWLLVSGDPVDGILPLHRVRFRGVTTLRIVGDGVSDYLGPICASADAASRLGAALDNVAGRVDVLILRGVNPAEPRTAAMLEAMTRYRFSRLYERCPAIDTSAGWDAFVATREGSWRSRLKRTRRRMEKRGELSLGVEPPSEKLFDELCEVERASWKWDHGFAFVRDPVFREFLRDLVVKSLVPFEIWVCRLDGVLVAFALVFELRRGLQYYWPTYREDTSGSGLYLLADIVRSCCNRRLPEFDFLQGDESYKLDWMTHEHRSDEIVVPGRGVKGRVVPQLIRLRWWLAGSAQLKEWRRRALVAWRRVRH